MSRKSPLPFYLAFLSKVSCLCPKKNIPLVRLDGVTEMLEGGSNDQTKTLN